LLKIIFMIDNMNGFGGAQRVISSLANEASKNNVQVLLILTGDSIISVYELNKEIEISCYETEKSKWKSKIGKIVYIRSKIKKFKPTIIIPFLTMVNIMAIIASFGLNIPLLLSERNDPDKCSKLEKILSRFLYRFSNGIVVQTEEISKKISSFYRKKIYIIPNPITETNFVKKDYSQKKRIIAVGRLNEQKNYPLMIEAFSELLKEHPEYILEIFGIGILEEKLKNLVISKGLSNSIMFFGNVKNIIEVEIAADFFLMTSNYEGMPNALAEAMSIGLPCISTNCDGGGAANLIVTGENGQLIEKGNINQLLVAMEKYVKDVTFAEKMGKNAKEITKQLNVKMIMSMWYSVFTDLSGTFRGE